MLRRSHASGPAGSSSTPARAAGEEIVKKHVDPEKFGWETLEDAKRMLAMDGRMEFDDAYADPVKTGHLSTLDSMLKLPGHQIINTLETMFDSGGRTASNAKAWALSNRDRLRDAMADEDHVDILDKLLRKAKRP